MQTIQITQWFNASQQTIFDVLSDHEQLGPILNAQIKRIKDATGKNKNGLGSVRSISIGVKLLEETVTTFDEPNLIEYTITNDVPVRYHLGRLVFSTENNKTKVEYTIQIETKIDFIDPAIKFILETSIKNGLKKLAAKYN